MTSAETLAKKNQVGICRPDPDVAGSAMKYCQLLTRLIAIKRSLQLYDSSQYPEPISDPQSIFPLLKVARVELISAKICNVAKTKRRNLTL
jgi:hypothetical protein